METKDNEYQTKLDITDKIRTKLISNESEHCKVFEECPQFVVVGAQSVGKSSVIRRISGISLPEAVNCCTRVSTLIELRKKTESYLEVKLIHNEKGQIKQFNTDNSDEIKSFISKAQTIALKEEAEDFSTNYNIIVSVHGPDKPNVTLVDLPGFTNVNDDSTEKVETMVKTFISMPGTLVLHIVKGDQDYNTSLGNDFIRKNVKNKIITVLTHLDKTISNDDKDIKDFDERIKDTLSYTKTDTFTILGKHLGSNEDELTELNKIQIIKKYNDKLKLGIELLKTHIENKMEEHLVKQLPKLMEALNLGLKTSNLELTELNSKTPYKILNKSLTNIRKQWDSNDINKIKIQLKDILEKCMDNIKNYQVMSIIYDDSNNVDTKFTIDDLEIGNSLYLEKSNSLQLHKIIDIKKHNCTENKIKYVVTFDNNKQEDFYYNYIQNKLETYSNVRNNESIKNDMIKDIKSLAEQQRGFKNWSHIDPHPIICQYAKQFADFYKNKFINTYKEIEKVMFQLYKEAFEGELECSAVKHIWENFQQEFNKLKMDVENHIDDMYQYNANPDMIFSMNTHYENQIYKDRIQSEDSMATDDGGIIQIYHKVMAYIKTQRKFITESGCKQILYKMYVQSITAFDTQLNEGFDKYIDTIEISGDNETNKLKVTTQIQNYQESINLLKTIL